MSRTPADVLVQLANPYEANGGGAAASRLRAAVRYSGVVVAVAATAGGMNVVHARPAAAAEGWGTDVHRPDRATSDPDPFAWSADPSRVDDGYTGLPRGAVTFRPTTVTTRAGGLTVTADSSRATDLTDWLTREVKILQAWYPSGVAMLTASGVRAPSSISVTLGPTGEGMLAYTMGTSIVVNPAHVREDPNDTGAVVHELAHVIQRYPAGRVPGWLTEGIADYARFYGYEPGRITAPHRGSHYTDGYRTTAYFLHYVATHYRSDIVGIVSDAARRGTYQDSIWMQYTGKSLGRLWAETPKSR